MALRPFRKNPMSFIEIEVVHFEPTLIDPLRARKNRVRYNDGWRADYDAEESGNNNSCHKPGLTVLKRVSPRSVLFSLMQRDSSFAAQLSGFRMSHVRCHCAYLGLAFQTSWRKGGKYARSLETIGRRQAFRRRFRL